VVAACENNETKNYLWNMLQQSTIMTVVAEIEVGYNGLSKY
jgi:hypothetical protein